MGDLNNDMFLISTQLHLIGNIGIRQGTATYNYRRSPAADRKVKQTCYH